MSVLDCQQHITADPTSADGGGGGLPSSFSLNDLVSHAASPLLRRDVTTTAVRAGEFPVSVGEIRSVRQWSTDVVVESQRTFQSAESCARNSPPTIDFVTGSRTPVQPQQSVYSGVYTASPQSCQSGQVRVPTRHTVHDVLLPSRRTYPSVDLDHNVFYDSEASPKFSVDQPPPLPPKTSVVSKCVYVCVSVCLFVFVKTL